MNVHDPVIIVDAEGVSPERLAELAKHQGEELIIWRARNDSDTLNHRELLESMIAEAATEGHEPCDFNFAGVPNIYLRGEYGHYDDGSELWHNDGFAMIVRPKVTT